MQGRGDQMGGPSQYGARGRISLQRPPVETGSSHLNDGLLRGGEGAHGQVRWFAYFSVAVFFADVRRVVVVTGRPGVLPVVFAFARAGRRRDCGSSTPSAANEYT
jgi:hypothetical protein